MGVKALMVGVYLHPGVIPKALHKVKVQSIQCIVSPAENPRRAGLLRKALLGIWIRSQFGAKKLDGSPAVQRGIRSQIHFPHAALTELLLYCAV